MSENGPEVTNADVDLYYALEGPNLWISGCGIIADAASLDMDLVTDVCTRNMGWAAEAVPSYAPGFVERWRKAHDDISARARTPRGYKRLFNRWLKEEDCRAKEVLPRPTPATIANSKPPASNIVYKALEIPH